MRHHLFYARFYSYIENDLCRFECGTRTILYNCITKESNFFFLELNTLHEMSVENRLCECHFFYYLRLLSELNLSNEDKLLGRYYMDQIFFLKEYFFCAFFLCHSIQMQIQPQTFYSFDVLLNVLTCQL